MSELLTYGFVGGVGGNHGSYPAADGGWRALFAFVAQWRAAAEFLRSASLRKPRVSMNMCESVVRFVAAKGPTKQCFIGFENIVQGRTVHHDPTEELHKRCCPRPTGKRLVSL